MTDAEFRTELHDAVAEFSRTRPINEEVWATFARSIHYVQTADDSGYDELGRVLGRIDAQIGANGNRLFYLATPPAAYRADHPRDRRRTACAARADGRRVVVEKPFGHDLQERDAAQRASCRRSSARTQVFRIDHYLGKETVQNILVLRFANSIFEPIWNAQYVDHVQITVAESIGVEERAGYYDSAGSDARHRAEPPPAAPRARGDGAAGGVRRRRGPRREGQGLRAAAADPERTT